MLRLVAIKVRILNNTHAYMRERKRELTTGVDAYIHDGGKGGKSLVMVLRKPTIKV